MLHGVLRRYEIEYRRVDCNESDPVSVTNSSWKLVAVANTSLSRIIGDLVFWSCYEFKVRAVTVGNGPFSDIKQLRTKEDGELFFVHLYFGKMHTKTYICIIVCIFLYISKLFINVDCVVCREG